MATTNANLTTLGAGAVQGSAASPISLTQPLPGAQAVAQVAAPALSVLDDYPIFNTPIVTPIASAHTVAQMDVPASGASVAAPAVQAAPVDDEVLVEGHVDANGQFVAAEKTVSLWERFCYSKSVGNWFLYILSYLTVFIPIAVAVTKYRMNPADAARITAALKKEQDDATAEAARVKAEKDAAKAVKAAHDHNVKVLSGAPLLKAKAEYVQWAQASIEVQRPGKHKGIANANDSLARNDYVKAVIERYVTAPVLEGQMPTEDNIVAAVKELASIFDVKHVGTNQRTYDATRRLNSELQANCSSQDYTDHVKAILGDQLYNQIVEKLGKEVGSDSADDAALRKTTAFYEFVRSFALFSKLVQSKIDELRLGLRGDSSPTAQPKRDAVNALNNQIIAIQGRLNNPGSVSASNGQRHVAHDHRSSNSASDQDISDDYVLVDRPVASSERPQGSRPADVSGRIAQLRNEIAQRSYSGSDGQYLFDLRIQLAALVREQKALNAEIKKLEDVQKALDAQTVRAQLSSNPDAFKFARNGLEAVLNESAQRVEEVQGLAYLKNQWSFLLLQKVRLEAAIGKEEARLETQARAELANLQAQRSANLSASPMSALRSRHNRTHSF